MSNPDLHKCETPDCLRLVSAGSAHCCGACALAAAGKYEIHESGLLGHSEWCDERAAERGPWLTPAQAMERLMDEAAERRASETRARGWLPNLVVDERVPPGVIALASDSHVIAYRQDTGRAAEMRRDEHGQWSQPQPVGDRRAPTVEVTTSEPDAALYFTCQNRHPLAACTTTILENGVRRATHHEIVCPACEADGITEVRLPDLDDEADDD